MDKKIAKHLLQVFAVLILVNGVAGITINKSHIDTVENLTQVTGSVSEKSQKLAEKGEQSFSTNNLSVDEFYLPPEPCRCSANELKQLLAPLNGSGPFYLPAYRGCEAQTISLTGQIPDNEACRLADSTSMCERPSFTFIDIETAQEIKKFPHKGITWDESTLELTLQPQRDDPIGHHKVLMTAYLFSQKDKLESMEIQYFIDSEHSPQLKLQKKSEDELPEPPGTNLLRRLQLPPATTVPDVMAAPTTTNSGSNVIITWSQPPSDGGSVITSYSVLIVSSGGTEQLLNCNVFVDYTSTSCTVPIATLKATPYTLGSGNTVQAKVYATNAVGSQVASAAGGAATMTVPNPPNSLTSNVDNNYYYSITLNWVAPTVEAGKPVIDYQLTWDNGSGTTNLVLAQGIILTSYQMSSQPISTSLLAKVTPLVANTVYKFKLKSRNAFGLSTTYSNEVSVRAAHVPDAPVLANNAQVTASGIIGIKWEAPNNRGSPIIDYQMQYSTASGTVQTISGITTTSYTISSLTADVVYDFKITACNVLGCGASSVTLSVRAASRTTAPLALLNNAAVTGSTNVGLTWTAPTSDGGSPIQYYWLSYQPAGGSWSGISQITTTSYNVSPLEAGVDYTFKVMTYNAVGYSLYSSDLHVLTAVIPSVPAAPSILVNSNISLTITWVAPATGGSAIT